MHYCAMFLQPGGVANAKVSLSLGSTLIIVR